MDEAEQQYRDELTKAGVDLPELQVKEEEKEETPEPQPEKEEEAPQEEQPKPEKKESIYDRYKGEKQARQQAEKERDELKTMLDARAEATTPEEKQDAQDEIDAFLSSHKEWNKDAIKDLVEIARKGVKPELDEATKRDLEDFKTWKSSNAKLIEQQMFNEEFEKITPALTQLVGDATPEELKAIREKLDEISHTKEWHDKDLDYVAFKNKDTLSALVSPRKRGMEPKGKIDTDALDYEFDPNADYSSMTPAQRKAWEDTYSKATKSSGLLEDSEGRKIII